MKKQTGTFDVFNPDNELFTLLSIDDNPPEWWLQVLRDDELYIEIRKDNYINVYHYGGCIAKIWSKGKQIYAETHIKYLSSPDSKSKYQSCLPLLQTTEGINTLKAQIRKVYLKEDIEAENCIQKKVYTTSEKRVQGEMILSDRNKYIDSEFAYRINDENNKIIRFDLVALENDKLTFVELKLITDPRLTSQKDGKIEIVSQMEKYAEFLRDNKEAFIEYYRKVADVKKKIGIINEIPPINDVNIQPTLLIVDTYSSGSEGRTSRTKNIKSILSNAGIETIIQPYRK